MLRVLVIEDEKSVATGVKRALEAERYQVDVAWDGATGLELATSKRFDAIVLDVMLPKVNGYDLSRRLRAAGDTTPIVMLTAKTGQWDIVEGLDHGADVYLTKPFSMAVLLAHVRSRTRGPGAVGSTLVHGDLRVDIAARRGWRGDVEIELTRREVELLAALLRRRDVVPKADLLRLVWGDEYAGDPNVVEVYVSRLRRKLDVPFGTNDIETIRGVGYRMRDTVGYP